MSGNPAFGKRLRGLREAKRTADPTFTLRQFATAVGVSATFLSKVERGEFDPPAAERIIKMAGLLGVDADKLLALANKVDPDLERIIKEKPAVLPDLLRAVRGMSAEEISNLTDQVRKHIQAAGGPSHG